MKKTIVPIIMTSITVVLIVISSLTIVKVFNNYKYNQRDALGVNINGVHLYLHELDSYRSIVEPTLHPIAFTSNNDKFTKGFTCEFIKGYSFKEDDLGMKVVLPYRYIFDKNVLVETLTSYNESAIPSKDAYFDTDSKKVVEEVYGTQVDIDRIIEDLNGYNVINIEDYYIKPTILSESLRYIEDNYNAFKNWSISYRSSKIKISIPENNISVMDDGSIEITDLSFIDTSIDALYNQFTDLGKDRPFVTHDGDNILISGGTFGNVIDKKAEKEEVLSLLDKLESQENREPIYSLHCGTIGSTYIEVSIKEQMVYYFKNGDLISSSSCVTGTADGKHNTPTGVWYFDFIKDGKYLYPDGATVGTWVNKWMRFTPDGCGLHDAGWRSSFGGEIYKTNGSHGCVNLPPTYAVQLFEEVYYYMPVVVY